MPKRTANNYTYTHSDEMHDDILHHKAKLVDNQEISVMHDTLPILFKIIKIEPAESDLVRMKIKPGADYSSLALVMVFSS
jgi:hypothetical protein